jgi:hypothetical protein
MNIFIDTSVLHQDPFWKNNSNSHLLSFIKRYEIDVYISDVVYRELRKNYLEQIETWNREHDTLREKASSLNLTLTSESKRNTDHGKLFDDFYEDLFTYPSIKKIDVATELYSSVMEWAVAGTEPFFSKKKSQFKDAVIWISYMSLAKNEQLEKCFLLTNNINDFCQLPKKEKPELNQELLKQGVSFEIYESINSFLRGEDKAIAHITETKYPIFRPSVDEIHKHLAVFHKSIDEYLKSNINTATNKFTSHAWGEDIFAYQFRIVEFLRDYHGIYLEKDNMVYGRLVMECHLSRFRNDFKGEAVNMGYAQKWVELSLISCYQMEKTNQQTLKLKT